MKKNLFENFTPKKAVATVAASALGLTLFAGYVSHAFTLRNFTPIGAEKATEIALGHLNSTDGSPLIKECELDGRRYDIEIIADGVEYEYKIDAKTGSVLSQKFDKDSVITTTSAPSDLISEAKAKEIAFNHAGVSSSSVTIEKVELDKDDGVWEYEVDFRTSDTEYDYEINASTGAVIKAEKESRKATTTTTSTSSNLISEAKAKEIAFNHAGVSSSSVTVEKVELDRDDGVWEYEIEFRVGHTEYDYEINASTGSVIKAESDVDDDFYDDDDRYDDDDDDRYDDDDDDRYDDDDDDRYDDDDDDRYDDDDDDRYDDDDDDDDDDDRYDD